MFQFRLDTPHGGRDPAIAVLPIGITSFGRAPGRQLPVGDAVGVGFEAEAFPFPGTVGGGAGSVAVGGTGRTIGSGVRRTQRGVQLTPAAPLFRDRAVSRAALAEWPGGAVAALGSGGPAVDGRSVTVVAFDSHQVQALPGPWTAGANARYIRHSYNFTDTLAARFGTRAKGARPHK